MRHGAANDCRAAARRTLTCVRGSPATAGASEFTTGSRRDSGSVNKHFVVPPPSFASVPKRYPSVAECIEPGRTRCTHTECRYHLAHRGYWEHRLEPTRDCSLDVAREGPRTLEGVSAILGMSAERVRQIEERAIKQLRHNQTLKRLHHGST